MVVGQETKKNYGSIGNRKKKRRKKEEEENVPRGRLGIWRGK